MKKIKKWHSQLLDKNFSEADEEYYKGAIDSAIDEVAKLYPEPQKRADPQPEPLTPEPLKPMSAAQIASLYGVPKKLVLKWICLGIIPRLGTSGKWAPAYDGAAAESHCKAYLFVKAYMDEIKKNKKAQLSLNLADN